MVSHEKPGTITIDEIRDQVINDIDIRPYYSPYKIYIIADADLMTPQAQNALLKTIEEPPEYAVILLLTNNIGGLLPTIQSRCVRLDLKVVDDGLVKKYLMEHLHVPDYQAEIDASFAQGSIGRAKEAATSQEFAEMTQNALRILKYANTMEVYELSDAIKSLSEDKQNINDYLDIFQFWFRDVLMFKATQEIDNLVFKQEINFIREQAKQRSYENLENILDSIQKTKVRLKANVNFDLAFELLFLTIRENRMTKVVGVRFRNVGKIYYFSPKDYEIKTGDHVIVETARGIEYGKVVLAPREVGEEDVVHPLKEVLRVATKEDDERGAQNRVREREAFKICQKKIREHGLEMKLIDAEYTFDNNKVLFYFTADGRIDFRQLVKDLAAIFKTRIELRQIGVRDETKILGGIGICGRCLCCHTYLSEFAPVSIKMAKEQNLSLNQTKISGVCGRLMCCLKNEQETYEELNKKLPGLGDTVTTPDGLTGTVHSVNVLRQRVKVIVEINDEKEIQEFPVDDLKFRPRKKKVKVSEKELKELGNLEDKKGDSKLND